MSEQSSEVRRLGVETQLRAAELNSLDAARRLCALIGGGKDGTRWKLDGRLVTEDAGMALISLSAYLNDVAYFTNEAQS